MYSIIRLSLSFSLYQIQMSKSLPWFLWLQYQLSSSKQSTCVHLYPAIHWRSIRELRIQSSHKWVINTNNWRVQRKRHDVLYFSLFTGENIFLFNTLSVNSMLQKLFSESIFKANMYFSTVAIILKIFLARVSKFLIDVLSTFHKISPILQLFLKGSYLRIIFNS